MIKKYDNFLFSVSPLHALAIYEPETDYSYVSLFISVFRSDVGRAVLLYISVPMSDVAGSGA